MLRRLFLLLATAGLACAQPVVQLHVRVPMRDGVRLCTNIFRPGLHGRFPTVLHRTPYRKASQITATVKAFLDRGYAVVTQDVRGRYDSEGEFRQVIQEEQDGAETLSWIVRQAWSDGRVAMYGGSYVGIAQWRAALSGHPALKAIAPAVSGGDEYFDRYYSPGGAFRLAHRLRWIAENFKPPNRPVADFQRMITFLPLGRADRFVAGRTLDFYQEAMAHPAYDAYWRARSTRLRADRVRAAALIEAGWYDPFLPSDIAMWKELRARARPARLIIGPWGHNMDPRMPGAELGPSALLPLRQLEIDWFDAWLRHRAPPAASAVLYYVMGADEWRESAEWPPEGVETEALYLDSGGAANSLHGDGRLAGKPPAAEAADRYEYDPKRAVPTLGGANCCNFTLLPWGPLDQRPVEGRRDVLVGRAAARAAGDRRAGSGGAARFDKRTGHRFHRQAGRRGSRRCGADPDRRHPAAAVPGKHRADSSVPAGDGGRSGDRHGAHGARVRRGPCGAAGGVEQQFSEVRPEPEHGAAAGAGDADARGAAGGLART